MDTQSARFEVSWDTRKQQSKKCAGCQCVLTPFTGIHHIKKTSGKRIVCGMCLQSFIWDGWREVFGVNR